jgi:hypothetical protein
MRQAVKFHSAKRMTNSAASQALWACVHPWFRKPTEQDFPPQQPHNRLHPAIRFQLW